LIPLFQVALDSASHPVHVGIGPVVVHVADTIYGAYTEETAKLNNLTLNTERPTDVNKAHWTGAQDKRAKIQLHP